MSIDVVRGTLAGVPVLLAQDAHRARHVWPLPVVLGFHGFRAAAMTALLDWLRAHAR